MSLLGNYSFHTKNAGRLLAGSAVAGCSSAFTFGNFQKNGAFINIALQDGLETLTGTAYPLIGFPWGYSGIGWKLPIAIGAISGQRLPLTVDGTANGAQGIPGTGFVTFTIDGTGMGGLVAAGEGLAILEIISSGEMAGYIQGEGSGIVTITADGDTLTSIGWVTGDSILTITGSADPLGFGKMEGTTDYSTELTTQAIAQEVWRSLAIDFDDPGSMGEKLNDAGSAANPWTEDLPGSYIPGQAGYIMGTNLPFLDSVIKNKKYLNKEGSTWYLIIKNGTETADILKKALKDKNGNDITDIAAGILAQELKSSA